MLILTIILKHMDIDFTLLSFKIVPPHKIPLDDTREEEESTANPFRRTSRLFKYNQSNHLPEPVNNSARYIAKDCN